jgi:hypothetical protein
MARNLQTCRARSTSCRACSARREALRLDCCRASCPGPGRRWHRCRLKWTCRFRSGSASSNCPWSATNRAQRSLVPDRRSWNLARSALRFVHMRRSRRAPAPLQLRLLWDDHDNPNGKVGFRVFQRDRAAKLDRFRKSLNPPAAGYRRAHGEATRFGQVHGSAGRDCIR